jgi:subtilisin family serine protease
MKSMRFLFFSSTKFFGILLGFLILIFSFSCQKDNLDSVNALVPASLSTASKSVKTSNYIVITKSETLTTGVEGQLSAYGKIIKSIPEIGEVVIKPTVSNFESKVEKLAAVLAVVPDINVKWIEPIKVIEELNPPSIGDNELYFSRQWGMDAINAPEAWNTIEYPGQNAKVFILDSGIDAENPDLAPNLNTTLSTSFVEGEGYNIRPGVFFSHGTHVAGIIAAADNGWGVIGVAPYAEIVMVKVLSEYSGSGSFSGINQGIVYAANKDADVINMSLGATLYRNGFYLDYDEDGNQVKIPISVVDVQFLCVAQQRAINYAYNKGVVIVTSAGNDAMNFDGGGPIIKLPGGLANVITVSATAPECWINNPLNAVFDIPASYTDYGKSLVELAAPGGDYDGGCTNLVNGRPAYVYDYVFSNGPTNEGNAYFYWACGTSQAAPHVAGVAALIISKNGGEMNPQAVAQKLYLTADKIGGNGVTPYFGYGRVNAFRAVTE